MGIAAQRRWRERGVVKTKDPRPPGLPAIISREYHLDEIAKLTKSYELKLGELRKQLEPQAGAEEDAKASAKGKRAAKASAKKS